MNDPRRPCGRVTDGRCMFEAGTCTPVCHLDSEPHRQPTPAQPCLSTPDCVRFDGCPSCRPEDYAW